MLEMEDKMVQTKNKNKTKIKQFAILSAKPIHYSLNLTTYQILPTMRHVKMLKVLKYGFESLKNLHEIELNHESGI